jgi:hypothetical protein
MARKTFFSFHYERDVWRAGQVRNCDLIPTEDEYGFIDSVDWESIKRQGDEAIELWINAQLQYTSTTAVLIGKETAERPWVRHEIVQSWNRGNGMLGVWIHNIRDQNRSTDVPGSNPFDQFRLSDNTPLSSVCKTYDWIFDDGRNNLGKWIEDAYRVRGKYGTDAKIVGKTPVSDQAEKIHVVLTSSAATGFTPRSPWCAEYAKYGR